jgi:hypothetical protein
MLPGCVSSMREFGFQAFPSFSKLGGINDVKGLPLCRNLDSKLFPNFYLAETGDIKALRSKKFGNNCFSKTPLGRPPNCLPPPFGKPWLLLRIARPHHDAAEKPECPENDS